MRLVNVSDGRSFSGYVKEGGDDDDDCSVFVIRSRNAQSLRL